MMILIFSFGGELRGEAFFSKKKTKKEEYRKTKSIFDVMCQRKALTINLVFDVDAVVNNRKSKKKHPADLFFVDKKGNKHKWKIKINVRGGFRRTNCSEMPPLKLNFKKSDLKKAGLSEYDDFKLVTHCVEEEALARTLILREYLAYKYFNILTKNSFRVQLLNINYIDSKTGEVTQHLGFIIEDLGLLRHRLRAEKCENPFGISPELIDKKHFKKMALFQYM
ncbi:MAG TPA: hypothetical protein ENJ53_00135, partial [Phaeodactylibacter sp.]|nr:hypothetical protein [Phaeodactylibacter sp.]